MWLFTTFGFFSIVQKPGDACLTVRARVRSDLDQLREEYLPELSPTTTGAGTDYSYRATINHADFARGLAKIAESIHYDNFREHAAATLKDGRDRIYLDVWNTLRELKDLPAHQPIKKRAYGGVVIDRKGRILLREPRHHLNGYVWTFPKARPRKGESPEETALREVLEQTGMVAKIERRLPGKYLGPTSTNAYYLMSLIEDTMNLGDETISIRWASARGAQRLISQSVNSAGRERDLEVLKVALETHAAVLTANSANARQSK